ncbi:hypothetical protein ACIBLA_35645 [Streptomyces sp. NPDC050433]|uniref:hypothetical protein n=1 Tax=unclassified Streptomyces TaxID=2593676 RepID=UPI003449DC46
MSHSITGRARAIALTVAALVSVPVLASTAVAVPDTMYAPHAQAAARISSNGAILASKGIDAVTRPAVGSSNRTGTYCITFTDPELDLAQTAPQVTVEADSGTVSMRTAPHSFCNNARDTLTVFTRNTSGNRTDLSFSVLIP